MLCYSKAVVFKVGGAKAKASSLPSACQEISTKLKPHGSDLSTGILDFEPKDREDSWNSHPLALMAHG